ncbi:hypothetical protein ACPA9J_23560 [Pseudomonas aeruginosa]
MRPLFCRGIGPFRWAALSGDPQDTGATDAKVKQLIPDDAHLHRWLDMSASASASRSAGAHLLAPTARQARPGLQRDGAAASCPRRSSSVSDHLDSASRPAPTARPRPCRRPDAVSDWPLLNAPAEYRQRRHPGLAASRRRRRHYGLLPALRWVIVCDGSDEAAERTPGRVDQRPGYRGDAVRRRRLPGRHRLREGAGPEPADDHRPALTSKTASTPAGVSTLHRPDFRPANKNGGARAAAEYSST